MPTRAVTGFAVVMVGGLLSVRGPAARVAPGPAVTTGTTRVRAILMRRWQRTVVTISVADRVPTRGLAMLIPVPATLRRSDVRVVSLDVFDRLDALTAPQLVRYVEHDPCSLDDQLLAGREGRAGESEHPSGPSSSTEPTATPAPPEGAVAVKGWFSVGEYDGTVVLPTDSDGLVTWLRSHNYPVPRDAARSLGAHVDGKTKFLVLKLGARGLKSPGAQPAALRLSFDSGDATLPLPVDAFATDSKLDLVTHVIHPTARFEAADDPNAFIPTNLDVEAQVKDRPYEFYDELLAATLENAGELGVVTEYARRLPACSQCDTAWLTTDLILLGGDVLGGSAEWVVTRMHARYDKRPRMNSLALREAPAVRGGNFNPKSRSNSDGGVERAPDGANAFQARYIVRSYFPGKVTCGVPKYERWDPEQVNSFGSASPTISEIQRPADGGRRMLKALIRTPIPSLGIEGQPAPVRKRPPPEPPPRRASPQRSMPQPKPAGFPDLL